MIDKVIFQHTYKHICVAELENEEGKKRRSIGTVVLRAGRGWKRLAEGGYFVGW